MSSTVLCAGRRDKRNTKNLVPARTDYFTPEDIVMAGALSPYFRPRFSLPAFATYCFQFIVETHTHTHTHIYIYIYQYPAPAPANRTHCAAIAAFSTNSLRSAAAAAAILPPTATNHATL